MIHAVLIGAGNRGVNAYAPYALNHPDQLKFAAVAEPDKKRREQFAQAYGIAPDMQFSSWEQLLAKPKLADVALICTQDKMHYEPTMQALRQGYDIMLEKPISPVAGETLQIAEEADRLGKTVVVGHVLRYTHYFNALKSLLAQELIGKLMTVQWNENVGFWHQAHSFVRGNWRNSEESSPMILAKCCHDMDILQFLIGGECKLVSSFGSLSYFKEENAPSGSTERCTDGCAVEKQCNFSALRWYFNDKDTFIQNTISLERTREARLKAIKEGPYGRCVYRCDNDVVDHQVVNLEFKNGVTVAFTMTAFTNDCNRTFKIMGTTGEIRGHLEKNEIEIIHFSGERTTIYPPAGEGGHSGGDFGLMRHLLQQISRDGGSEAGGSGRAGRKSPASISASSHMISYAAEHSRITGQTVVLDDYIKRIREEAAAMNK